jgi:hypothetical protein
MTQAPFESSGCGFTERSAARRQALGKLLAFALTCALASFVLLGIRFDSLPDQVPLTRWGTVAKSVPNVFRIPAINLVSIALLGLLARATSRSEVATGSVAVLLLAAGVKSILESLELAFSWALAPVLGVTVVSGIVLALYLAKEFWKPPRPQVSFNSLERWTAVCLCAILVALQFLVPAWG